MIWEDDDLTDEWRSYMSNIDGLNIELPDSIPFELSDQRKRTAAAVYHTSNARVGRRNEMSVVKVRFSIDAYNSFSDDEWRDTLRHEAVHIQTVQNHNKSGHGRMFREYADTVGCDRHCSSFTDATYEMVCEDCEDYVAERHNFCKVVRQSMAKNRWHKSCREDSTDGRGYLKLTKGIDKAIEKIMGKDKYDMKHHGNYDRDYYNGSTENVEESTDSKSVDETTGPADSVDFDRESFFG